ncbi:hypothetical protein HUJ04_011716 [Dendroctonus ponderosae]|nr:hypothetical protein HUJ04_011716 [Dendroctonus ponderosae]
MYDKDYKIEVNNMSKITLAKSIPDSSRTSEQSGFPLNLADNCCVLSIPTITSTRDLQRSQSRCEEPSKVQEKRS